MDDTFICPSCGGEIPPGAPEGMCPKCLLAQGMPDTAPDELKAGAGGEGGPGKVIGSYRLLQKLGEGGFGVVYLAQQNEPVKRRVALKIIKPGMDSAEVIARFEAERQALALMSHDHIAQMFDAGTTDTGRPYFVMELVEGVPITEFCDRQKLSTRERLDLFVQVCQAVQHAHQKAIIHRDLKPSNILVAIRDDKPALKVIDFGVAKAISQELTERTLFTALGQMVGTPQYMSPEQADIGTFDIDTRSDIYSLGVVLYELLTGVTPIDPAQLRGAGYQEIQRVIREEEPPKPSTRLGTLGDEAADIADHRKTDSMCLTKTVRGDLDCIVMTALEKDRARRYETATALAADVQRYLDQEPVTAGPPGIGYKIGKFVRRNRTAVAVAASITFLLVAGIFGTSWFAVSSQEAKEDAVRAGEETKVALKKTEVALKQSRYEEAKAWLERARLHENQKNDFAAAMMAAKALGFRGFGAEQQSEEFRNTHPALLDEEMPEFAQLRQIAMNVSGSARPIWRSPISIHHLAGIKSVASSPDGATLASGSDDLTIKLWDTATGKELHSLRGHTDTIWSVAFSPDGATLASGSSDDSIKLWDVSSGTEIRALKGHRGYAASVAFSPDGSILASGSYDRTIKLWDIATGRERHSLRGHKNIIFSVAFSPDGATLASGSHDETIKLWDTATGRELRSLHGHKSTINSVAFSPDGATLASGSDDFMIKLWNFSTGKEIHQFQGHQSTVTSVAFSPDGALASGSRDQTIKLWNVSTGQEISSFQAHQGAVQSLVFTPDGALASGGSDSTIKLWDASAGRELRPLGGHLIDVLGVAFSPDGTTLASESADGSIKLWDVSTGRELRSLQGSHHPGNGSVAFSLAFSPDGTALAGTGIDDTIKLWDVSTGKVIKSLQGHQVYGLAFSPDGSTLASAGRGIRLWNISTGEEIKALHAGKTHFWSVAFSPDGATLASGSGDGAIKLWNVATGEEIHSMQGHQRYAKNMVFSPVGDTLASAGDDGTITLWNVATGQEIRSIQGHQDYAAGVAFSPDGATLASGGGDQTIELWDISSGKMIQTVRGHQGKDWDWDGSDPVGCVAFSPDGATLASGSRGGTIQLWNVSTEKEIQLLQEDWVWPRASSPDFHHRPDLVAFSPDLATLAGGSKDGVVKLLDVSTGKEIRSLQAHEGAVLILIFSVDGSVLASVGHDKTIKIWDVLSGKEIHSLQGHQREVWSVAFSRDGTTLASGGGDSDTGTIRLWEVSTGKEIRTLQGHKSKVWSVAFSPDGATLASSSLEETTKLWDVATGIEMLSRYGLAYDVAFSPDGRTLAHTGEVSIKLWDVSTRKEIRSLLVGWFMAAAFSPDGATVATAVHPAFDKAKNNTIKLWNFSAGKIIQSLPGQQGDVWRVAFSADGASLASLSYGGAIKLWAAGDYSPLDLAGYLDPRNPSLRIEGSQISWTTTTRNLYASLEFGFTNVSPSSHVGILRSALPQEEKNRALFWSYLHAENWNSARVLYARMTDPTSKETAREMTIRKRAAKAQSALDSGLYNHARWHLKEITPLLKSEETDPLMVKAKETISRLQNESNKLQP